MMTITIATYCLYLAITMSVTVWVAGTLHKNGRPFLVEAFHGQEQLADSVNHLLLVGFYLVNFGYVCYVLKLAQHPDDVASSIELLSGKLGLVFLVLGAMHFFNIYLFSKIRRTRGNGGVYGGVK